MKGIKKIICGAIVFVLAIAACIGVTGCFGNKDKGMSAEEKALRANAVEVLNNLIVDAARVDALSDTVVTGGPVDHYVGNIYIYNIFKKMLNNDAVVLGEYYRFEIVSEDNLEKYAIIYCVEISENEIIIKIEETKYEREAVEQDFVVSEGEDGPAKEYFSIMYNKSKPISLTIYSVHGDISYNYEYYRLTSDNTKKYAEYESVYKHTYNTDNIKIYYDYIKDNNVISLYNEDINGMALIYCNKMLGIIEERTSLIDYQSLKGFPQEIIDLFLEMING